jgi:hypothetical protein
VKRKSKSRTSAEFLVEVLADDLEVLNFMDMIETSNELVLMSRNPKWKDRKLIIDTLVYLLRVSSRVRRDPSYKPRELPSVFVATRPSTRKGPPRKGPPTK